MNQILVFVLSYMSALSCLQASRPSTGDCVAGEKQCLVYTYGVPMNGSTVWGGVLRLDGNDFGPSQIQGESFLLVRPSTGEVFVYNKPSQSSSFAIGSVSAVGAQSSFGEWQFTFAPNVATSPGKETKRQYWTCVNGVFGAYWSHMEETILSLKILNGNETVELNAHTDLHEVGSVPALTGCK